jgi:mannose/fructose/N-acetylgalactosamine-specific phosphotransferase system component IIC
VSTVCSGSGSHKVRAALLVAIPVAVALLQVAVFLFLRKRNRQPHKHVQVASNGKCAETMSLLRLKKEQRGKAFRLEFFEFPFREQYTKMKKT